MEHNSSLCLKKNLYKMDQIQQDISTYTLLEGLLQLSNFEKVCKSLRFF